MHIGISPAKDKRFVLGVNGRNTVRVIGRFSARITERGVYTRMEDEMAVLQHITGRETGNGSCHECCTGCI